jgi:hypothetical protein
MSSALEPVVPTSLREVLEGDDLGASLGFTFLFLTVGDEGWPHVAMLSAGELVVRGERTLGVALWSASSAARNASRTRQATLHAVADATSFTLSLRLDQLADLAVEGATALSCFGASVERATADRAPYAELETGVRFRLHDETSTLRRWERTRDALGRALDERGSHV